MLKFFQILTCLTLICVALAFGALFSVGRFKNPDYDTMREEASSLIQSLDRFHASYNRYPADLSDPEVSAPGRGRPDVWKDWNYDLRAPDQGQLYKYTGKLRQSLWCRFTYGKPSHSEWWLDDDDGLNPKQVPFKR